MLMLSTVGPKQMRPAAICHSGKQSASLAHLQLIIVSLTIRYTNLVGWFLILHPSLPKFLGESL